MRFGAASRAETMPTETVSVLLGGDIKGHSELDCLAEATGAEVAG